MLRVGRYVFKRAETAREFEQVHRLNHRTFAEEIAQHPARGDGRLVDKFHDKNVYFLAVRAGAVVGMVSGHDRPPFSVADRLPDPAVLARPGLRPFEVRLLAIAPAQRHSTALGGLLWLLYRHAEAAGHTHLFISGLAERVPLYRRLGFEPLGPAVACGAAAFVPMVLEVGRLPVRVARARRRWEARVGHTAPYAEPVILGPGLATETPGSCVWGAHHEMSKVANDLPRLVPLARRYTPRV